MSEVECPAANQKYDHQALMEELDSLNRQLEDMKETMMDTSVRAHILEADIASLFDPEVKEELRKVTEAAEKCDKTVKGNAEKCDKTEGK